MHPLRALGRAALLLLALAALVGAIPSASVAQDDSAPQCSDGIDNDSDNAIDGQDQGCGSGSDNDETDSEYSGIQVITVALPVVTIQGTVDRKGVVDIARLVIRARRGSLVNITCKGKRCPIKTFKRRMITNQLRIGELERKLKPKMELQFRVARTGQLGKYVRYQVRKKKAPKRTDACLNQDTGKVEGCFPD
jgi:hypothetical protein